MDGLKQSGQHYMDLAGLDQLRQQAQQDPDASLREVALQFEGIFMNMLLKSMRDANAAFEDSDSPFHSHTTQFYQQMHDSQLAQSLSAQGSLGLADLIVAQLGGDDSMTPASALNRGESLGPVALPVTPSVSPERSASAEVASVASAPAPVQAEPAHPPMAAAANPTPQNFEGPEHFVRSLMPHAREAAQSLGVDPMLLIAQSALETGWGRKVLKDGEGQSSHNLFNIKADNRWQGEKTAINALEFESELPVMRRSNFRVYENLKASFDDYVEFVRQPRYRDALEASDSEGYIRALHKAGYATDPQYADKIMQLFNGLMKQYTPFGLSE
ncbi:flagellar assembly peptidoglycan hydrolase FlgJ [Ferrimonas balearica]|uniref:flagellar assembly peptidoglycan hydrolase FlgJ n=1 Tax=Ferrimonas balearica TaxID=44012 RepID=UPI001C990A1E|nr:flagellar assembly peptidoglycan hydrolase FlgJ [Ferrimonas balearica]MBY5922087.1 flagellar assembly peptidoglycan hydrolase FlgJ [Ferrimonas balearica]MBY5994573.1 flagellar assembly peptidoglycan hydrolase FlgJ [Ferrimonas balearica]